MKGSLLVGKLNVKHSKEAKTGHEQQNNALFVG